MLRKPSATCKREAPDGAAQRTKLAHYLLRMHGGFPYRGADAYHACGDAANPWPREDARYSSRVWPVAGRSGSSICSFRTGQPSNGYLPAVQLLPLLVYRLPLGPGLAGF